MTSESKKTRRRYGAQFKAMVLAECAEPGASVAQVVMSHVINDNVVGDALLMLPELSG